MPEKKNQIPWTETVPRETIDGVPFGEQYSNVIYSGNVTEVCIAERENHKQTVQKLDKDTMVVLSTGEIIEVKHSENRGCNIDGLQKTFRNLRRLINTNFTGENNELMLTLTYAENETCHKTFYKDFEKFMKKLRYSLQYTIEYIVVIEPQERGAWHAHVLVKSESKKLYIPNETIAELWGHGFTTTKRINEVDNIGAYLCAYLTNLPLESKNADSTEKKYIKGARLYYYPPGINYYRCSRGLKKPLIVRGVPLSEAFKQVEGQALTFQSEYTIKRGDFKSTIRKLYFNSKRTINKQGGFPDGKRQEAENSDS